MRKIWVKGILLAVIITITLGSIFAPKKAIRDKIERVNQDFLIVRRALEQYYIWLAFYPLPDWVSELPENKFLQWTQYSYRAFTKNKEQYLQKERESRPPIFLNGFKVFTEFFKKISKGKLRSKPKESKHPDYFSPVKGHTKDPFDKQGRVYGYALEPTNQFYLLVSSGPDGERDIDVRKFDHTKKNFGFETPFENLTYDPTNGLTSRGDIFLSREAVLRSGGILEEVHPKKYNSFRGMWTGEESETEK